MKIFASTTALPAGVAYVSNYRYIILSRYTPGGRSFGWEYADCATTESLTAAVKAVKTDLGADYSIKVIEQPAEHYTPAAVAVVVEAAAVTPLEVAALKDVYQSDFQDSDKIDSIIGNPVWSGADTKSAGGVYSSLIKKGFIACNGKGNDKTVWLTEAARPIVAALLVANWKA